MDVKERRLKTKQYDLLILANDLGFTPVKISQRYYSLVEHDSVRIDITKNAFRQYSTGAFGDTVAFCMSLGTEKDIRFKNLEYAVSYVENKIKQNPWNKKTYNYKNEKKRKKLILPLEDYDNRKLYYYMENRGIDISVVDEFIINKWLYQEHNHHNLVFVSYKDNVPVFISEKGIIRESRFMKEHEDNDYDHCFFIDYDSDILIVTESIIDMMSLMTLDKNNYKKYSYLSINSTTKDRAIYNQLKNHPNIKQVQLRLDNDEAGVKASNYIKNQLLVKFPDIIVDIDYPPTEKDWNDYLVYDINRREKMDDYTIIF